MEYNLLILVLYLQEFYGDYIAVNPHLFSLNILGCCQVWKERIFFLSLFIRWELIQQVRKNLSVFSEFLKRVEIGIQPSCPEQLKD